MHSRMHAHCNCRFSCHTRPLPCSPPPCMSPHHACPLPCMPHHACPLPCMPPTTHTPMPHMPPAMHAPLPCTPPAIHAPLWTDFLTHACENITVTGSRLLLYWKNTWLRTMCCLQIIWRKNRKSQRRLWSAAIPCGEHLVQAGCD